MPPLVRADPYGSVAVGSRKLYDRNYALFDKMCVIPAVYGTKDQLRSESYAHFVE